jgi:uncharacterized protein YjbI with pentapeptide repeats
VVLLVDLAWLQVPRADATIVGTNRNLDRYLRAYPASASLMQQVSWLFAFNPVDLLFCTPGAWGCRYLTVTQRIVVARILDTTTFVALRAGAEADEKHRASFEAASLRGRTLRFADLSQSELFAADLTDADLQRANLKGAALRAARLPSAQLQRGNLRGAQLQGADLSEAQLQGAYLSEAQLQGGNLRRAQLQGAELSEAQLQGADLSEAQLQGADLSQAQLQGADLFLAQLQGAYLSEAQLQGADLGRAQLQGGDLRGAQLQGAYLGHAGLWNTRSDGAELGLADLRAADFDRVSAEGLLTHLPPETPDATKQQIQKSLTVEDDGSMLSHDINTADGKILVANPDDVAWRSLDRATQLTTEPADIDPALAKLLADTVAPLAPSAALQVAWHVISLSIEDKQRPLIRLLGCRLQEQVDAKRVTLRADTVEQLRKATGPCGQTSQ